MPGTRSGGFKAKKKILKNNPNHYQEMGAEGGRKGHTGGWYGKPEEAAIAGAKGAAARERNKQAKS